MITCQQIVDQEDGHEHPRTQSSAHAEAAHIEARFADHIDAFAQQLGWALTDVRAGLALQYNGYRFAERDVRVYNPFSVLNAFSEHKFGNYWFTSGTPTFLIDLLRQERWHLTAIEGLEVDPSIFSPFEIDHLRLEALLFQTGYLTIDDVRDGIYRLDYPNQEVKVSFLKSLPFAPDRGFEDQGRSLVLQLAQHLRNGDLDAFFATMHAIFTARPRWNKSGRRAMPNAIALAASASFSR